PNKWLENESTQELIAELDRSRPNSGLDVVKGGNSSGVYADELLAVSYAGWISPAFQLKVNQAFLDRRRPQEAALPALHDPALQAILHLTVDLDSTKHRLAQVE